MFDVSDPMNRLAYRVSPPKRCIIVKWEDLCSVYCWYSTEYTLHLFLGTTCSLPDLMFCNCRIYKNFGLEFCINLYNSLAASHDPCQVWWRQGKTRAEIWDDLPSHRNIFGSINFNTLNSSSFFFENQTKAM